MKCDLCGGPVKKFKDPQIPFLASLETGHDIVAVYKCYKCNHNILVEGGEH